VTNVLVLTSNSQERFWIKGLFSALPEYQVQYALADRNPGQPMMLDPDVEMLVLFESSTPLHLLQSFLQKLPQRVGVIVLSRDPSPYRLSLSQTRPAGWGAMGDGTGAKELGAAIEAVRLGLCVFQPGKGELEARPVESLTRREQDVLARLAQGLTNREIGEHLHLSENTVKSHVAVIYAKLGVNSRAEATARAAQLGWVAL
jgi:DNA-binding NarL/FixJ family response regulator